MSPLPSVKHSASRTAIHDLDCLFCPKWFANFDTLSAHVRIAHSADRHGPVPEYVPTARQGVTVNKIPKPNMDDAGGGDFPDFLKPKDIGNGKAGATAIVMLTGAEVRMQDGNFGAQMIVPIKLGKTDFDWSVKLDTPNHRALFERFGSVPKKWKGKKLTLQINPPIRKGYRPYIAVGKA